MVRLVDQVWAQIPRQLRGRLDVTIKSDPYYLRVEVIVVGKDGVSYSSGPLESQFTLPDWFISHMCSIPVDDNRLTAQLWDSLELDEGHRRTIYYSP